MKFTHFLPTLFSASIAFPIDATASENTLLDKRGSSYYGSWTGNVCSFQLADGQWLAGQCATLVDPPAGQQGGSCEVQCDGTSCYNVVCTRAVWSHPERYDGTRSEDSNGQGWCNYLNQNGESLATLCSGGKTADTKDSTGSCTVFCNVRGDCPAATC
ncbi:hypothetical protein BGZ63DRAFT_201282 [Mariannaea sp. PMI_226]|nr:hypothetical protein BGZ63DRAFT_201282 [Mariannaea sp. PMI_226]